MGRPGPTPRPEGAGLLLTMLDARKGRNDDHGHAELRCPVCNYLAVDMHVYALGCVKQHVSGAWWADTAVSQHRVEARGEQFGKIELQTEHQSSVGREEAGEQGQGSALVLKGAKQPAGLCEGLDQRHHRIAPRQEKETRRCRQNLLDASVDYVIRPLNIINHK
jgi:hypothetical protein